MFEKYQTTSAAGTECAGKTRDKVRVEMKRFSRDLEPIVGTRGERGEGGLVSRVLCLCWPEEEKDAPT